MHMSSENNEQEFLCFEANQTSSNCEPVGSAAVLKAQFVYQQSSVKADSLKFHGNEHSERL